MTALSTKFVALKNKIRRTFEILFLNTPQGPYTTTKDSHPPNNRWLFYPSPPCTGAVTVEYVLLLVACVSFAYTIYALVDMDPQNPGWVISVWKKILIPIAEDIEQ